MTEHVRITYDGPALANHTMDVRQLAPALLAFGDLCEEAGRAIFGDTFALRVEVKASFRTGSFGIDLSVVQQLTQQIIDWLTGDGATAAANAKAVLELIGVTSGGSLSLIGLLRWLRNRRIKRVETTANGRRVITEDDDAVDVEERVVVLLQNRQVRESLQRVIDPIERDGIERVAFGSDETVLVVIERREAAFFRAPQAEDVLIQEETRLIPFSIVSLSFRDDNKWRMYDGQATVFVTMADQEFLERVHRNLERFAKGDILIAKTRVQHWHTASGGLRTDYTVLKVLEHRMGEPQIPLPYGQ
ncbi:hypothetical protein [Hydrogenophilus thermoluteolus]|uniref:Uncharacterized protein n=1 Tax=Hydrogenophilus thermoluteolus TaxID=297 RepID=A0A2Z6DXV8_HYDTE|nr:hypothetical protein [Hydrogenophilus thermoluteolus]BBD77222.1 hypothetical protein HPTL_0955 [Hydrogenophilus thermoluteolus]